MDETTDISCRAQLSVIVRYVDSAGKIQERFIGFFDVSGGRDAQSVFDVLNENMQGYNFKDKLVAQTYDGAAVMASALNGLQAKVKAIAPSAMFVHCYAHRLNLVLSQGAKCLPECRIFLHHSLDLPHFSQNPQRGRLFWSLQAAPGCPETLLLDGISHHG